MEQNNDSANETVPTATLTQEINNIQTQKKELEIAEMVVLNKAINSDDPTAILKAMEVVKIKHNDTNDNRKAVILDPFAFDNSFGYKEKPTSMSYSMLRNMAKTPIILSIINTRKNQLAAFAQPQTDPSKTGFIITKKQKYFSKEKQKLTKQDQYIIENLTEFMLNCGQGQSWSRLGFEDFLRVGTEDSLVCDQLNFEVVRNRRGIPIEFLPIDPDTIRIADSYDDERYEGERKKIGGYYPSTIQIIDQQAQAEFYPWEMAFGTRNPSSSIYRNGYGRSELEDMVGIITSLLWSDQYNRNFFKQGSTPKGLLKLKSGSTISADKLGEFKQAWRAMMSGVNNSWKVPVLEADFDWIDLQKTNQDMEFSSWNEFLIKLCCALYTIDPSEIGFPSGNSSDASPMFEKSNSSSLKYSKDKGLKPLTRFWESILNKQIVSQLHPDFCINFVGLDAEDEATRKERRTFEATYIKTINEMREDDNLPPIENGDIIMNSVYTSYLSQKAMAEQGMGGEEDGGQFEDEQNEEEGSEQGGQDANPFEDEGNPFEKAFNVMLEKMSV